MHPEAPIRRIVLNCACALFLIGPLNTAYSQTVYQPPLCPQDLISANRFSSDPKTFAETLQMEFSKLVEAIPTLSPREMDWLEAELKANDGTRAVRAVSSKEYAIRQVRTHAVSIRDGLQQLSGSRPIASVHPSIQWSFLTAALIDWGFQENIDRLVLASVISKSAIPSHWMAYNGSPFNYRVRESISIHFTRVANHVLTCLMPQVSNQK